MAPPPVPPDIADETLMLAFAKGDAQAFESLYDRHAMRVWRYLFRGVQNAASADELAQDVWLRVAQSNDYAPRAGAAGRPVARFTTWLLTLARNRLIDHLRATRPTVSLDEPLGDGRTLLDTLEAPSDAASPVRHIESRQQAAQLLAALDALPPPQRDAFLLQAEGGMSVAEIAAATGVTLETAKSRLRYARAALRRALEDIA
jgi:RNA polymerase sigma-70 factor (ECF subfamily)